MTETRDLAALVRAETPLILIETPDETRVVKLFQHVLTKVLRPLYRWSITEGLRRVDLDLERDEDARSAADVTSTLAAIRGAQQRGIYLLFDFHPYLGYATTQRALREILQREGSAGHVIVMVGTRIELPADLERHGLRFELRLPDDTSLRAIVLAEADRYALEHAGKRVLIDPPTLDAVVRNLAGLDAMEARRIARHLIFDDGVLGPDDLPGLAKLKFELLNRSGYLHFEYDTAQFTDVAGLSRLKRWVAQRRAIVLAPNPPPGMDLPKGLLLLGVQGCGKSLAAKAVAGGFGVPLVRLDFGTLYNKFQGETERNLREALASAEQLAPCVLWIDEIEKGMASAGQDSDGGVSRRVLGYFLTWMAERKSAVVLVATANSVHELPPELLRKGRFDEIFFVDLPAAPARGEIFRLHLDRRGMDWTGFDLAMLAERSSGFSGAEIEQAIVSAMYAAHADDVQVSQALLHEELNQTRPLSVLMAEQVQALRDWARTRTVPAD